MSVTFDLDRRGVSNQSETAKYEHSYRVGSILVKFLLEGAGENRDGVDLFLNVYEFTCRNNLYDNKTGLPLIKNGLVVGPKERIMERALEHAGLVPMVFSERLTEYSQSLLGRQARIVGWVQEVAREFFG